jgi:hypothetical protein
MLPKNINDWIVLNPRPINRYGKEYEKIINNLFSSCSEQHLKDYMITSLESKKVLIEMGINPNTAFYEYYVAFISTDSSENEEVDLLYDLDEIYEDYKQPFHADNYPNITDRYLRISSIEGEGSYFYDKKTDAVYDVDWGEMDDFMVGKLKPIFTSFYAFLEWYYSEEG